MPAMSQPGPAALAGELSALPELEALAARVRAAALAAAAERRADFLAPGTAAALPVDAPEVADGTTPWGSVREILERGAASAEELALASALFSYSLRADYPSAPETERARAESVLWLAAHTRLDPLSAVDATLGDRAAALWSSLAQVAATASRSEAVVAAAALSTSASPAAARARATLAETSSEPMVRALLHKPSERPDRLSGELAPSPHGPVVTTLLALTGILFVMRGARLLGRLALAYKKPAALKLTERGLELEHRTELLGRVLKNRETIVPVENLARVTREVRFSRLGLYAGLFALVIGSYIGMGLIVDGARVPGSSPPLLGMGLLVIGLGIAIDFGLTLVGDEARGKVRIVVIPKKGPKLCIGALDPKSADAMLSAVAELPRQSVQNP